MGKCNLRWIMHEKIRILDDLRLYLAPKKLWRSSYNKAVVRKKFECARLIQK